MVSIYRDLNLLTHDLWIDKQYEEIKKSCREDLYHLAVRNNHLVLLEKSTWLIGKIWFKFQVLMGWLKIDPHAIDAVRQEMTRVLKSHEIQKLFVTYVSIKLPKKLDFIGQIALLIEAKNTEVLSAVERGHKEIIKGIQRNSYEEIPEVDKSKLSYLLPKFNALKLEVEAQKSLNHDLQNQVFEKDVIISQLKEKSAENDEIIENLSNMISAEQLMGEFMT